VTPEPVKVENIIRNVAEDIVLPRFQNLASHEISTKGSGDIVTIADEEAEYALGQALKDLLPGSVVIGEEEIAENPIILNALTGDEPVWVIDPVDGTQNFANGNTRFAMIVALIYGGKTVAGWIHEPVRDTTVWALIGEGVYEANKCLQPNSPKQIDNLIGTLSRFQKERLSAFCIEQNGKQELPKSVEKYGCVGAEYADLARGNLQYAFYKGTLKPWDHLAGVLIHAESGGYSALVETRIPLKPDPKLRRQAMLLAPNEDIWHYLLNLLVG
tara:strand:- start:1761 stop:2576 length:816 start_codon:yes stop_codon:yes gene_type:complete